ncbi:methyl-CpG-binding domain protein 2-like [Tetranychus urticae]|uniref:methyl-CpG-binding domain protein 2-like n=1 Tax=Tetranychus urticae TaxID=32264 RepID=UPI0003567E68|nr:methyl-CpG-binding domain protein 2-like [Tetranychus urticae]
MAHKTSKDLKSKKKQRSASSKLRKQPVAIVRSQSRPQTRLQSRRDNNTFTTRTDIGNISPQKPQQLFWYKRLEGLRATILRSNSCENFDLPDNIKPVGPYIGNDTAFRSVISSLHLNQGPIIGQTAEKSVLEAHPDVFLDPKQPLVETMIISDDDIRDQEEVVNSLRRELALALQDYEKSQYCKYQ